MGDDNATDELDPTDRFLRAMLRRTVSTALAASLAGGGLAACADSRAKGGVGVAGARPGDHGAGVQPRGAGAGPGSVPLAPSGQPDGVAGTPPGGTPTLDPDPVATPMAGDGDAQSESSALIRASMAPEFATGTFAPTCVQGRWSPLDKVYLAVDVDYLALYGMPSADFGPALVDEVGTACVGRPDARCSEALQASVAAIERPALVSTRESEVRSWSAFDVRELLAPIDSAEEALILAYMGGFKVDCVTKVRARRQAGPWTVTLDKPCSPGSLDSFSLEVEVRENGDVVTIDGGYDCPVDGRRPPGFLPAPGDRRGLRPAHLGRYFARAARNEAASVAAFDQLAAELHAHAAPKRLVARARNAAHDERRHARTMARLAWRFGAQPERARVARTGLRTLEAIALDNAVEGCVNETFSALLVTYQSATAWDPVVRRALAGVAHDETRHGSFSLQLHRFCLQRLAPSARVRVEAARQQAAEALSCLPRQHRLTPEQARQAGLPDAATHARLTRSLSRQLLT